MQKHVDPPGGVILTEHEAEVVDLFLEIVIEGDLSLTRAALSALSVLPQHDPEFVAWLLDCDVDQIEEVGSRNRN